MAAESTFEPAASFGEESFGEESFEEASTDSGARLVSWGSEGLSGPSLLLAFLLEESLATASLTADESTGSALFCCLPLPFFESVLAGGRSAVFVSVVFISVVLGSEDLAGSSTVLETFESGLGGGDDS